MGGIGIEDGVAGVDGAASFLEDGFFFVAEISLFRRGVDARPLIGLVVSSRRGLEVISMMGLGVYLNASAYWEHLFSFSRQSGHSLSDAIVPINRL